MRRLSADEVQSLMDAFTDKDARPDGRTLRCYEKAPRAVAVQNFLMSAPLHVELAHQLMNLQMDARSYGWSQRTIDCIAEGLRRMNNG